MKRKIILICLLCAAAVFGGCQSSQKSDSSQALKTAFGEDLTAVETAFQWNLDDAEKQVIPDTLLQQDTMYGYSLELHDMDALGGKASTVYLQFMGSNPEDAGLTLVYAEYPEDQDMKAISDYLTKSWGDSRQQMYCSWPGRVYWLDIWAGTNDYDQVDAYLQKGGSEKLLWGSAETVEDVLDNCEDPKAVYESWSKYSRIYAQSLKNDWKDVKKEPLVTAVLLKNSKDYKTQNTVILDGFNLYMANIQKKAK